MYTGVRVDGWDPTGVCIACALVCLGVRIPGDELKGAAVRAQPWSCSGESGYLYVWSPPGLKHKLSTLDWVEDILATSKITNPRNIY